MCSFINNLIEQKRTLNSFRAITCAKVYLEANVPVTYCVCYQGPCDARKDYSEHIRCESFKSSAENSYSLGADSQACVQEISSLLGKLRVHYRVYKIPIHERRGRMVNTLASYSECPGFKCRPGDQLF